MKSIIFQIAIILILILSPFSSVVNFLMCYILLYLASRNMNFLSPIFWLFVSWNILFINAFSGVIKFNSSISLFTPVLFCISLLELLLILHNLFLQIHELKFVLHVFSISHKTHLYQYFFNIISFNHYFLISFSYLFLYFFELEDFNILRLKVIFE